MKTPWGEHLNTDMPLAEYPRLMLQRGSFTCLNGWWEYQITSEKDPFSEKNWKKILVPFALGTELSGTKEILQPGQVLWYRHSFAYQPTTDRTILNFEAVDQCCRVWVNGVEAGAHEGGYAPFSFDISGMIKEKNEILVRVTDDSDQGIYAYGKQKLVHGGIWYRPMSGIYQTVWLEDLPAHAVEDLKITPDFDHSRVYLRMAGTFTQAVITVFADGELVHRGITSGKNYTIPLESVHPWSPEDPFLYQLFIQTEDETIKSYFAMRKFSSGRDSHGKIRFLLNGKPAFISGVLDQGYTPDGWMTYPSEDMMRYELTKLKEMGFNMVRKHIKVECRRWYSLCDQLGLLVMQDMPSGGGPYSFWLTGILPTLGIRRIHDNQYAKFGRADEASRKAYYLELDQMLDTLYNYPCIFAWVPFNEGWGQFDSCAASEYIRDYDSTRLIDSASGWHDQGVGDFNSRHCYFYRFHEPKEDGRIALLSEFGGLMYLEYGHSEVDSLHGLYRKYRNKLKLNEAVFRLYEKNVLRNIPKGLSGCVFTQVADVEEECNGLFTADRRVIKIDARRMRKMNQRCIRSVK